jgi:hypothetical protein
MTEYGDYATWVTFEVMAYYQVRLIISRDLVKSWKGRLAQGPDENSLAFCYHVKDQGRSYIFLQPDSSAGTIAHECWHIVHQVLSFCGVEQWDDEVVAYYLDHMVEKVYEFKKAIALKSSTKKETTNGKRKRRTKPATASA